MRKFTSLVAISVFGVSSLVLPIVAPTDTGAYTSPGYNGKIAFISYRDENSELYTMDPDGSNQVRLTNTAGDESYPKWSPDGLKIAFSSNKSGNSEVYVVNADGTNEIQLSTSPGHDFVGAWSPDSSKLTYHTGGYPTQIMHIIDVTGNNHIQATAHGGVDENSDWSPDGSRILFASDRDSTSQIYVMDADGTNQTRLTNNSFEDSYPSWSPDGSRILFASYQGGSDELYTMDSNGENQVRLTNNLDYDSYGIWSPNGDTIVIHRYDSETSEAQLVVRNINSGVETKVNLTSIGVDVFENISWSPDGKHVRFAGWHADFSFIDQYIYSLSTDTFTQLTFDDVYSESADWQSIPNTSPNTSPDSLTIPYQTPTLADILANDTDEETLLGVNLSIAVQPTNGTASVVNGKVRYVPAPGYQGADFLTYQICDSFLLDQKCATEVLNVTVSAPVAPSIAVTKINEETYSTRESSYVTPNHRPTFSGTATPGAEVRAEIHSDPIVLTTTADEDGNWSVTPTFDLPSGEHMVYISATLHGLTTEIGEFGLSIQLSLANTGISLWIMLGGGISIVSAGLRISWHQLRSRESKA